MQRTRVRARGARVRWLLLAPALGLAGGTARAADAGLPALGWPLGTHERVLTGGFGEARVNRFHAGLDLSTGGEVGAEVLAPADASVERVRTSGVGYGRSLYLRTDDGRLIVFGHLDAFSPRLAAYVDSVQRATGDYEQDLWPPAERFRFARGTRVAWSGQSGAGPPHLHVEVRHGDMAINPLLAGFPVPDTVAPKLERLILEPLDEHSWVERRASPYVLALAPRAETLVVQGRARLTVVASDAANAAHRLPVRTVSARWGEQWVECHMDSISWAGEMAQFGWIVDRDRVTASGGVILDAPAGFRPRFMTSSRPTAEPVELVRVAEGDPPRALELLARDAVGNATSRRVWLRGPRASEQGPDSTFRAPAASHPRATLKRGVAHVAVVAPAPKWSFAALPDQRVRIRVTRTPAGISGVRIEQGTPSGAASGAWATWDGSAWTAVLNANGMPDPEGFWIKARASDGKPWLHRGAFALWPTSSPMITRLEDWAWFTVTAEAAYEPGAVMVRSLPISGLPAGAAGERAVMDAQPYSLPLKHAVEIALLLPAGLPSGHTGICRRDDEDGEWEWSDARWDSAGRTFRVSTTRLGQFALVRDLAPPEVTLLPVPAGPRGTHYSTWALTARVADGLSGIASESSTFVVDGARVPTEYDPEARELRWRPRTLPAAGRHTVRAEVQDHAGNRTVRSGTFVIASR